MKALPRHGTMCVSQSRRLASFLAAGRRVKAISVRKMRLKRAGSLACAIALLLGVGLVAASQSGDADIVIDRGFDGQTRIAVVPFLPGRKLAGVEQMSEIIALDLERSGLFDPVGQGSMLSFSTEHREVFFRDWRILQTDYLVIGRVDSELNGDVSARYELYDVTSGRLVAEDRPTVLVDRCVDRPQRR